MAEFYVTYGAQGRHYLAAVAAPQRPPALNFADEQELNKAMDALGHAWELRTAIEVARQPSTDWLERMAAIGALKKMPKPPRYIFGIECAEGAD